jgi:hypothetical protein
VDTTLIPALVVRVRAWRKGLFCGQATFGRCASKKTEWVYGFKVALVVGPEGIITALGLAPAASEERPIGDALIAFDRHGAYLLADKGFTGVEWERLWMEVHGALVAATPKNDSRRAWSKEDRRWASGKRQIIEGVIGQLSRICSAWSVTAPRPWAGSTEASGGQGRGVYLRPADQRFPGPTAAPSGRPVDIARCTSVV